MKTKIKSGSATALKNTEAEASHKACSNCPSLSPTPAYTITCGQMRHMAEKWSHAHLPFAGEDHILSSSIPLPPAPQMMAEDESWPCFQAKNPTKQNNIGETKGSMDNLPKYLTSVSSLFLMCHGSNHCYKLSNPCNLCTHKRHYKEIKHGNLSGIWICCSMKLGVATKRPPRMKKKRWWQLAEAGKLESAPVDVEVRFLLQH